MGKVTSSDLLQVKSRLAEAENALLSAIHSYDVSRLNLCQLLEIDDYTSFIPYVDGHENISYVNDIYPSILDGKFFNFQLNIVFQCVFYTLIQCPQGAVRGLGFHYHRN